jgi:hypothetical protein
MKPLLPDLFKQLHARNAVLALTGWIMLVLLALMLLVAPFDSRTILGINPWIKPIKFAVSITIFVWTIAWFSAYVARFRKTLAVITWGIAIAMLAEIAVIMIQAARGTTSHFNDATTLDAALFSFMGNMIGLNTVMVFLMLILFCFRVDLPGAYLWGIRLGLVIMLFASAEGGLIVMNKSHAVGVPDGGPGLPIVNWSTEAGDLRIAHFLGLHALQLIPLAGFIMSQRTALPNYARIAATFAFAILYVATFAFLLMRALQAKPLF